MKLTSALKKKMELAAWNFDFYLKSYSFFSYKFADALSVKPQVLTLGPLLLLINLSH